jgi:hypothetical protein
MKPAASRGFGTKAVFGANFVSTSPTAPSSKLPSSSRPLDSVPLAINTHFRQPNVPPQVPHLKPLFEDGLDIDIPDAMPWYNGETAHEYTMHLLALSGSDAFVSESDHVADGKKQDAQKGSKLLKFKSAVLASSFVNSASAAANKSHLKADNPNNPKALAAFKALSALSDEEKLKYPSWMTEGDIQTRKFLAQKIVSNRNRMRGLMIRADEVLGTDDLRENLVKKYGLNEATYTEVADMISNNRSKVKSVFDDIHALTQEQQAVLQEVQRALASTNTDLNFEISNLEDRLDDLQEDSLLQDAERSLGHAKSMRIKLSTSHSRFLDQAVERLTTKMPQVVKTKHMEQDLVLAADSLETMRKTVHECQASSLKAQKDAQEKSDALKSCQKELSEVCKDRDRLIKVEKEMRSSMDSWREKFFQSDRELTMEVRRGEEAEKQHAAILEITLRNAQKVVEDRIAATARAHEDQVRKLNIILFQMEQDLMHEKRLRDPDAVLKNAGNLSAQQNSTKSSSIVQQLEDAMSENEALQKTVDRLITEVNSASEEKESLDAQIVALNQRLKGIVAENIAAAEEKSVKLSEMQDFINKNALVIQESDEKIKGLQTERDDLQGKLLEAHQEILRLKAENSNVESQTGVSIEERRFISKSEKAQTFSVATQTLIVTELASADSSSKPDSAKSDSKLPTAQTISQDVGEADTSDQMSASNVSKYSIKAPVVAKMLCGTQTDVPYPRIGDDSARLAISCTRRECLTQIERIQQLEELAIITANSTVQETSVKIANQLAVRDREHKAAIQKTRKEMEMKLAIENQRFSKAQNHLEQFRGAVKKKLEVAMVEIKKMKRIGDFSNVGEVELHLNDVYIGATESFDSYQAEIDSRNEDSSPSHALEGDGSAEIENNDFELSSNSSHGSSQKTAKMTKVQSKLGAASKAIMFTKAAGKALNASGGSSGTTNNPDGSLQVVTVDDLKLTAEKFVYTTQQFISGCSFGMNVSSVSLERAQKKLSFCIEHFRSQKKSTTDSVFQLNLDLKDFKQKFEDSQMVINSQATALARAERDCRFLAQKLSSHEGVDYSNYEFGHAENGTSLPGSATKMANKSSTNSKSGAAAMATRASSRITVMAKSDLKPSSKSSETAFKDRLLPGSRKSDLNGAESVDLEDLSTCELDDVGETDKDSLKSSAPSGDKMHTSNQELTCENDTGEALEISADILRQSSDQICEVISGGSNSNTGGNVQSENEKRRGFRRHADELKLPTISCIYREEVNAPPLLDFATQVELGSLRSANKTYEAKIRKLEHLLDDKHDQLQHFSVLIDSSTRDQARSRNHAIDLSLEIHSERSKLETQLEWNAELLRKVASLEDKLKSENQALVEARVQESVHVKKLQKLTQKMQSFHQRCEDYVQEERAPLISLFFEFWLRLGCLRKDIDMIFSLDSLEFCNFRSNSFDLSRYSSHETSSLVTSFTEMLARNSLPQLRDEVIQKFGLCCSDIASSFSNYRSLQQSLIRKKEEPKIPSPVVPAIPHSTVSTLPKISNLDSPLPTSPQFTHKQLLPTIAPKVKSQSFESASIEDAMFRNSQDVVEKLTSKFNKSGIILDAEANKKLLNSWAKLAPTSFNALKPENFLSKSLKPPISNASPSLALRSTWRVPELFSIEEEI